MTPEAGADDVEGLPEEAEVRGRVDRLRAHRLQERQVAPNFEYRLMLC